MLEVRVGHSWWHGLVGSIPTLCGGCGLTRRAAFVETLLIGSALLDDESRHVGSYPGILMFLTG